MKCKTGFSLIELLVVLALFGLLTTLLPQGLHKLYASSRAESAAYRIAGRLQDCAQRALQVQGIQVAGTGGRTNCTIESTAEVEFAFEGGVAPVFFADGSSNGGRIIVTHEERKLFVSTNRLNAKVSVQDDDGS